MKAKSQLLWWRRFLAKSAPSERQWNNATVNASGWESCACCALSVERREMPRTLVDKPEHSSLVHLGLRFYAAIFNRDIHQARSLFARIQRLVAKENKLP